MVNMTVSGKKPSDRTRLREWLMVCFTAVIAGSGIAGWLILSSQLEEMRASSADTKTLAQAAKIQAESAKHIAKATDNNAKATLLIAENAKRSLNATQKALRLEQRAWVVTIGTDFSDLKEGSKIKGTTNFINTGRTPAKYVNIISRLEFVVKGKKPNYTKKYHDTNAAQGILPPNSTYASNVYSSFILDNTIVNFIRNGDVIVYMHGIVKYKDIFNVDHWGKYCSKLLPNEKGFAVCEENNEMDEN